MVSNIFTFDGFVRALANWGIETLFIFLLIFAVMYAILEKIKIFGDRRNVNVIVALVIGLLPIMGHVTGYAPGGIDVVQIIKDALPSVSLVVIAVVMLLILIGIFGGEAQFFGMSAPFWVAIISIIFIVFIFGGAAGWWGGYGWAEGFFGSDAIAIIVMLLIFGIIISFITGADQQEEMGIMKRAGFDFGKIFPGNGNKK